MKSFLTTFLLLFSTLTGNCFRFVWKPQLQGRIIGGNTTTINQYPFMVSIQLNGRHFCGGTIINPRWILTAGHCVVAEPSSYNCRIGSTSINTGGYFYGVDQIIRHPKFNQENLDCDASVFLLTGTVTFSAVCQPISLPYYGMPLPSNTRVKATGWGTTVPSSNALPENLQVVDLVLWSHAICNQKYKHNGGITINQLCAGGPGKDSCQGDSGGPLFLHSGGRTYEIGIVSWGISCAQKYPGVYTACVKTEVLEWIRNTTGVFS